MTPHNQPILFCLLLSLLPLGDCAAGWPTGYWLVEEGDAVVQLLRGPSGLSGTIVWMADREQRSEDRQADRDIRNPDPAGWDAPLLGLRILWGFSCPAEGDMCTGGRVYDPANGATYKGTLTPIGGDRLDLRGYVGIPWIGRTSSWTRADPAAYGLP